MKKRVFSSGTEEMIWRTCNCDDCIFDYDPELDVAKCKFEKEIARAYMEDGEVDEDLIKEFTNGFDDRGFLNNCTKKNLDPIEEADPRQVTLEDVCGGEQ